MDWLRWFSPDGWLICIVAGNVWFVVVSCCKVQYQNLCTLKFKLGSMHWSFLCEYLGIMILDFRGFVTTCANGLPRKHLFDVYVVNTSMFTSWNTENTAFWQTSTWHYMKQNYPELVFSSRGVPDYPSLSRVTVESCWMLTILDPFNLSKRWRVPSWPMKRPALGFCVHSPCWLVTNRSGVVPPFMQGECSQSMSLEFIVYLYITINTFNRLKPSKKGIVCAESTS